MRLVSRGKAALLGRVLEGYLRMFGCNLRRKAVTEYVTVNLGGLQNTLSPPSLATWNPFEEPRLTDPTVLWRTILALAKSMVMITDPVSLGEQLVFC